MSEKKLAVGSIISADLTIPDAENIRDFYKEVIGWDVEEMPMADDEGEYADYIMKDREGSWSAGICHRRGMNKDLPPQWIVYYNVNNIQQSIDACLRLGGKVLKEQRMEDGALVYALIEDPAGAVLALTKV